MSCSANQIIDLVNSLVSHPQANQNQQDSEELREATKRLYGQLKEAEKRHRQERNELQVRLYRIERKESRCAWRYESLAIIGRLLVSIWHARVKAYGIKASMKPSRLRIFEDCLDGNAIGISDVIYGHIYLYIQYIA